MTLLPEGQYVSLGDPPQAKDAAGGELSDVLVQIASDSSRERVGVGDLLRDLEHRAIGALLFIFAVPNALPVPPGVSAVLGAPLIFLSIQLMLGRRAWLPKIIAERSLSRADFEGVVTKVTPWLRRAEGMMHPRLQALARPPGEHFVGALCLLMAVILFLPIPLGNMLPAFTICVLSLGVLRRDGGFVIVGAVLAAVAVAIVWGIALALIAGAFFVIQNFFGLPAP